MSKVTTEQIARVSICIGDRTGAHLRAQWTWHDSIEVVVSNGASSMGYRLEPDEMERLAAWLQERSPWPEASER